MSHPKARSLTPLVIGLVLAAALVRLVPHPPNFAPVTALALFGGACLADRRLALLLPLAAMTLSDLALGLLAGDPAVAFHRTLPVVYGAFVAVTLIGFALRGRRRPLPIAAATLAGSLTFFVLTNVGVWALGDLYPRTGEGLVAAFVAAIPFFHNALLGDAFYAALLFGGLALAERRLAAAPAHRPAA